MIDTTTTVKAPTTPLRDLGLRESIGDPSANDLDKDAFLQLLVAQLRYQDPLNPNDPSEFMATTAQFTVVEKLDELTQQGANTAIISGLSMASSLVGRTVTYMGADDTLTSGVVSSAQVTNGEVRLVTDSGIVDLSTVVGIGESASQSTSSPAPTAAAPTTVTPTTVTPTTVTPTTVTPTTVTPTTVTPTTVTPTSGQTEPAVNAEAAEVEIPVVDTLPTGPLLAAPASSTISDISIPLSVLTATDVPTPSAADSATDTDSTKELNS